MDIQTLNPLISAENSKADNSSKKMTDDFSTFLTLLTTQLQHPDPTDPMDSNEFTQQLVQFTGVEQQIQQNQNLEALNAQFANASKSSSASFLGKDAIIETPVGQLDADGVLWNYTVEDGTIQSTLKVLNEEGVPVYEEPANLIRGAYDFKWDGTDLNGRKLADGPYTLVVDAKDIEGKIVDSSIQTRDKITGVHLGGEQAIYTVGPHNVYMQDILKLIDSGKEATAALEEFAAGPQPSVIRIPSA